jgi:hypothetical protein
LSAIRWDRKPGSLQEASGDAKSPLHDQEASFDNLRAIAEDEFWAKGHLQPELGNWNLMAFLIAVPLKEVRSQRSMNKAVQLRMTCLACAPYLHNSNFRGQI